jgi:hypothetical protein
MTVGEDAADKLVVSFDTLLGLFSQCIRSLFLTLFQVSFDTWHDAQNTILGVFSHYIRFIFTLLGLF